MNALGRFWIRLKAATRMVFPRYGTTNRSTDHGRYGGRYAELEGGRGSSLVSACVLWMARTFPEAPPRVRVAKRDGSLEDAPTHPLVAALARPNPYYSGSLLWWATVADWMLSGNAYWLKVRSGADRVVQFWWLPAMLVEPMWDQASADFVGWYEYRPAGYEPLRLDPADVVHFRYGLDPWNPRKGLSPLGSLLRELYTDVEAGAYVSSMLGNMGVPGVVISPAGDGEFTQETADGIKAAFGAKFSGERRGEPLVTSRDTTVTAFGFSPEQMTVRELRRIPEERVTAVFGLPAVVIGLGAGLDRSTFANFREAREAAVESNLVPAWRLFAEELTTQVAPDFGAGLVVDFDLSKVRVLQDDQDALHARAREDVLAGLITVDEGRALIGHDPLESAAGEVLYVPTSVVPTAPDALVAPQAPPQPASGTPLPPAGQTPSESRPGASEGQSAGPPESPTAAKGVQAVGPFPYAPDPLPAAVYDAAERRKLARAWDEVMAGSGFEGMLDAEPVNGTAH